MNNQDQAAQVIRTWQKRHKYAMDYNPDWAAQNLAHDLHQAGLLATDLPEPSYIVTECDEQSPAWEPCGPEYVVTRYKEPITGRYLIGVDDSPYAVEPQEARELGLAILAAADYQENNNA